MTERDHWFEDIADHLGAAYLRYSFTKGTKQEVDFLVDELAIGPGSRVLDVGCGPGRHANELARRGIEVVGVDISERFIELATAEGVPGATFLRADARSLTFEAEFDVALSLCQGAFGLVAAGDDLVVLEGMVAALRPGGRAVISAFSSYFQVRYVEPTSTFDAASGLHHEHTSIKDEAGVDAPAELWTTCYTPRELRLLVAAAGLEEVDVWSVEPGRYERQPPTIETPEFLVVARQPAAP